ncbi:hypothetical protein BGW36DRAFT_433095 [Talaromyces proteolyticus]|uniref:Uncharacterized protein n=1 Tax=Talaromyces proteolyticus TaxID=1131652 RepID=A0AAD4KFY9_9EURO|nr:uncharacterized protein BGW36DRAFT_433095 [Talaromyces proteolyticus]KAH8690141.1 hypothetical protein BGW36DRAFT_433095 [Talaromyces proteolyticus]
MVLEASGAASASSSGGNDFHVVVRPGTLGHSRPGSPFPIVIQMTGYQSQPSQNQTAQYSIMLRKANGSATVVRFGSPGNPYEDNRGNQIFVFDHTQMTIGQVPEGEWDLGVYVQHIHHHNNNITHQDTVFKVGNARFTVASGTGTGSLDDTMKSWLRSNQHILNAWPVYNGFM